LLFCYFKSTFFNFQSNQSFNYLLSIFTQSFVLFWCLISIICMIVSQFFWIWKYFSRSLEGRLCDRILHVSNFQHLFYINHLQVMSPLFFCFPTNIIFHSSKNQKKKKLYLPQPWMTFSRLRRAQDLKFAVYKSNWRAYFNVYLCINR
jgi:hypothetical protein